MLLNDIKALSTMQFIHADPFDRLLMAQAANQRFNLVTSDSKILQTAEQYKEFGALA